MNIKDNHTNENLLQTKKIFSATDGTVISIQLLKGGQLKEHTTNVPALLICIYGNALYESEKGESISLQNGDIVNIEPFVKHWLNGVTDCNLVLIK